MKYSDKLHFSAREKYSCNLIASGGIGQGDPWLENTLLTMNAR